MHFLYSQRSAIIDLIGVKVLTPLPKSEIQFSMTITFIDDDTT